MTDNISPYVAAAVASDRTEMQARAERRYERIAADDSARRALVLNAERAWRAYYDAPGMKPGMTDDEVIACGMNLDTLMDAYNNASDALRAYDAARKVAT